MAKYFCAHGTMTGKLIAPQQLTAPEGLPLDNLPASCEMPINAAHRFSALLILSSGGFFRMNVFSLWRMSTSLLLPHACAAVQNAS